MLETIENIKNSKKETIIFVPAVAYCRKKHQSDSTSTFDHFKIYKQKEIIYDSII